MDKLTLFSPGKINLYLKITGKRPDGYHELKTLMQAVELFDELSIEKSNGGIEVTCDDPSIPGGSKNIVYKAAELLLGSLKSGVRIHLKKQIPALAGLGGGSGNAAFALTGINSLFNLNTPASKLESLALQCGADVPFFLSPGRALAEGIGERLTKIEYPEELFIILVNPGITKPSTKAIYERFKFGLTKQSVLDNNTLLDISNNKLCGILHNDLEPVVAEMYPVIYAIKEDLIKAGAKDALMSGSGLTVFGLAGNHREAEAIAERLASKYKWVRAVKSFRGQAGTGGGYGDHGSKDSP